MIGEISPFNSLHESPSAFLNMVEQVKNKFKQLSNHPLFDNMHNLYLLVYQLSTYCIGTVIHNQLKVEYIHPEHTTIFGSDLKNIKILV